MYGKGLNVTLVLLVARNFEYRIFPYMGERTNRRKSGAMV